MAACVPDFVSLHSWVPDKPDFRDWGLDSAQAVEMKTYALSFGGEFPEVDLRDEFDHSMVCVRASRAAAAACCRLVEYFRRRCEGDATSLDDNFLHQVAAVIEGKKRTDQLSLRSALKGMALTGIPPARVVVALARQNMEAVDTPACYMYAPAFRDLRYFRVNVPCTQKTLARIKQLLRAGIPCIFGTSLPSTLSSDPRIDLRLEYDSTFGGTAGVIVGYDDRYPMPSSAGAVCFQSLWGKSWGENGFGWLSYRLFDAHLVSDVWTIMQPRWLTTMIGDQRTRELASS